MCFFSTQYVKSGVSTVVVKSVALGVVIFQWFTCFIFILSNFTEYIVMCSLILVAAAVFLPVFWMKYNHLKEVKIEEKRESLFEDSYIHPLEESCNTFLKQLENRE